jgi:hypothetical protein
LYYWANGCTQPVAADVAGIGIATLKVWADIVAAAIVCGLQERYFCPPSDIDNIRFMFGLRRGIDCVSMAVDGTHIPWRPDDADIKQDCRNYKGWTSILVLAFATSDYIIRGADIGDVGRASDSTVYDRSPVSVPHVALSIFCLKKSNYGRSFVLNKYLHAGGRQDPQRPRRLVGPWRPHRCRLRF